MQLFIVFHSRIYDQCYADVPQDMLDKYFTFVAVNEKIPKEYTAGKYKVVNEWDLPIYNADLQGNGYKENSVLYHIFMNKLHEPYTRIGFFQYDMVFDKNVVSDILAEKDPMTYFAFDVHPFQFLYETWNYEMKTASFVANDYTSYFGKQFTYSGQYPLYNTFVIPTEFYAQKMMPWIAQLYDKLWPWCNQPPNQSHFGHVAGVYERVSAMVVGEEGMKCKLMTGINHDDTYKKLSY